MEPGEVLQFLKSGFGFCHAPPASGGSTSPACSETNGQTCGMIILRVQSVDFWKPEILCTLKSISEIKSRIAASSKQ